jgi:hypothetical protein
VIKGTACIFFNFQLKKMPFIKSCPIELIGALKSYVNIFSAFTLAFESIPRQQLIAMVHAESRPHSLYRLIDVNAAIGDHIKAAKLITTFARRFEGGNIDIRIDPSMVLRSLLSRFEFEFNRTLHVPIFIRKRTGDVEKLVLKPNLTFAF